MNSELKIPSNVKVVVPIVGFFALGFALLFFSGLFSGTKGPLSAMDFATIAGNFGTMKDAAKNTYAGVGGTGARDGFLFGLGLIPVIMLAMGTIEVVDHLGGLKAAEKLLSPVLRPLLGIPGIAGLALISSFQNTDSGAGMTRLLREENQLTEKERNIFIAFQFSAGAPIANYFSSGAALFSFITIPIIIPLMVMFFFKVFGANIMRFYMAKIVREEAT
ncbi:MAG: nucleoside recognition domain-containing protein [Negativicutes bacterium]